MPTTLHSELTAFMWYPHKCFLHGTITNAFNMAPQYSYKCFLQGIMVLSQVLFYIVPWYHHQSFLYDTVCSTFYVTPTPEHFTRYQHQNFLQGIINNIFFKCHHGNSVVMGWSSWMHHISLSIVISFIRLSILRSVFKLQFTKFLTAASFNFTACKVHITSYQSFTFWHTQTHT